MKPTITYIEAKALWEKAQNMKPKEKYKSIKYISENFSVADDVTLEEIDFYTDMIKSAIKIVGHPEKLSKKLTMLNLMRFKIQGIDPDNVIISLKKNLKVTTETATILVRP